MIGNPRTHRRGDAQRFVNAAEVVECEPQVVRSLQIFHLLLKALVSRVMRRIPIPNERFWRLTCDVQMRRKSGLPMTGTTPVLMTSAGEYRCSPSRGSHYPPLQPPGSGRNEGEGDLFCDGGQDRGRPDYRDRAEQVSARAAPLPPISGEGNNVLDEMDRDYVPIRRPYRCSLRVVSSMAGRADWVCISPTIATIAL